MKNPSSQTRYAGDLSIVEYPDRDKKLKIGILDRNGNGADEGIMPEILEREMARAGFKRVGKQDFTKSDGQDYFLIFIAN